MNITTKKSRSFIVITALVLISAVILSVLSCGKKQILEVEKFYIYDGTTVVPGKSDPTLDELNKHGKREYSDAESLALINSFKVGKKNPYLWKGYWHGVLVMKDKTTRIIRVSRYGGFFWDVESKKVFEIEPESKIDAWQHLINPMN